jgi:hypothetical protein
MLTTMAPSGNLKEKQWYFLLILDWLVSHWMAVDSPCPAPLALI